MDLTLRPRSTPPFDEMSELLQKQLDALLVQARRDGPDGHELIDLFDVLDAEGRHVYDMHLFCDDDGQVYRTGTLEHVASFSQGGATGSSDQALLDALNSALEAWMDR
jgi:hypothetical protein